MAKVLKTCDICQKDIKPKEDYYILQSYKQGTYIGKRFYHWKCFNDKVHENEEINVMKRDANNLMSEVKKMLQEMHGESS